MKLWLLLSAVLSNLLLLQPAQADSPLEPLLASGALTIDTRLDEQGTLVPGQRAKMIVEIATNTWFTGGTRIRLPEVAGLVILQTDQFAANASESRGGQSWVIERWTIDIYPQQAGDFRVPPLALSIKVNGGELGNLEGEAESPALEFSVSLPDALEQADFWVASSNYSVRQTLDRETNNLQPGDAFERRIEFKADDVLAMMLPAVEIQRTDGLAAYPAPPELENSNNRGQSSGSRVQSISYVAEKPGDYLIPARDFFWWDTRSETLQVVSIPAVEVHVGGTADATSNTSDRKARSIPWKLLGWILSGLAIVAIGGALLWRYRPWQWLTPLLAPCRALWQSLLDLRKPALPQRLNPDSSAGD